MEERRRTEFFSNLVALYPSLGIARARDRARAASSVSRATASRLVRSGRIPAEYRTEDHPPDRYDLLERVMKLYSAQSSRKPEPPPAVTEQSSAGLDLVERRTFWLVLSRVRGLAALIRGPSSGSSGRLEDFPSWIDLGARDADAMREYYPLSLAACARFAEKEVVQHVLEQTPPCWWSSLESWRWLSRWGLRPGSDGEGRPDTHVGSRTGRCSKVSLRRTGPF